MGSPHAKARHGASVMRSSKQRKCSELSEEMWLVYSGQQDRPAAAETPGLAAVASAVHAAKAHLTPTDTSVETKVGSQLPEAPEQCSFLSLRCSSG